MRFWQRHDRFGDALVFEGVSQSDGHDVSRALWLDPSGVARRAVVRVSFEREGRNGVVELAARLRVTLGSELAPAVFAVYGRDRRVLAWVEEDLGGLEVRDLFRRQGIEATRLPIALHVARRMATAWARLQHRAPGQAMILTPARVRIGWDGYARLLGRIPVRGWPDEVADGDALVVHFQPTIDWLAPEALLGHGRLPQNQIYALGLMLFEAITGVFPFRSANVLAFISELAESSVPRLSTVRQDVPRAVVRLVDTCTARDPAARFGSWPDVLAALDEAEASVAPFDPYALSGFLASLPERAAEDRRYAAVDCGALAALDPGPLVPVEVAPLGPREEDTLTAPLPWTTRRGKRANADAWGTDARPMVRVGGLLLDARAVTAAEYARFVVATSRAAPPSWGARVPPRATEDVPVTGIALDDAKAYASWAGKRLPDSDEWERAVLEAGARILTGEVWELTTDPHGTEAWVVRGGRWRDHPDQPARPGNLSHSSVAADVGFRCVVDV